MAPQQNYSGEDTGNQLANLCTSELEVYASIPETKSKLHGCMQPHWWYQGQCLALAGSGLTSCLLDICDISTFVFPLRYDWQWPAQERHGTQSHSGRYYRTIPSAFFMRNFLWPKIRETFNKFMGNYCCGSARLALLALPELPPWVCDIQLKFWTLSCIPYLGHTVGIIWCISLLLGAKTCSTTDVSDNKCHFTAVKWQQTVLTSMQIDVALYSATDVLDYRGDGHYHVCVYNPLYNMMAFK